MKQLYRSGLAAGAAVAVLSAALAPAMAREKAGSEVFQGLVQHVSTDNLKVTDPKTKHTESFLLMPHFGNIFKADGRTTAQQKDLAEGQYVKVYFDQKAFGVRHADRILILDNANITMQKMKS
jgi:hypothetical protein